MHVGRTQGPRAAGGPQCVWSCAAHLARAVSWGVINEINRPVELCNSPAKGGRGERWVLLLRGLACCKPVSRNATWAALCRQAAAAAESVCRSGLQPEAARALRKAELLKERYLRGTGRLKSIFAARLLPQQRPAHRGCPLCSRCAPRPAVPSAGLESCSGQLQLAKVGSG